jgi:hypothetical protein
MQKRGMVGSGRLHLQWWRATLFIIVCASGCGGGGSDCTWATVASDTSCSNTCPGEGRLGLSPGPVCIAYLGCADPCAYGCIAVDSSTTLPVAPACVMSVACEHTCSY